MLKHVVFFKFKQGVAEAEIVDLEKSLAELPPAIPEILSYEFGRDVVRSERSYDLALVSTFRDLESLQRYQIHPDHQIVLQKVNNLCESVLAVDFLSDPNLQSAI
ncbi:MAG: Dabb family protein [Deltaproteobacteria bacterium]|nr:Dabb family protein [Deltaproteobacteria bacterium]